MGRALVIAPIYLVTSCTALRCIHILRFPGLLALHGQLFLFVVLFPDNTWVFVAFRQNSLFSQPNRLFSLVSRSAIINKKKLKIPLWKSGSILVQDQEMAMLQRYRLFAYRALSHPCWISPSEWNCPADGGIAANHGCWIATANVARIIMLDQVTSELNC
jgi:hypothetical protein